MPLHPVPFGRWLLLAALLLAGLPSAAEDDASPGPRITAIEPSTLLAMALPARQRLVIRGDDLARVEYLEFTDSEGRRYRRRPDAVTSDGRALVYDIAVGRATGRWRVETRGADGGLDAAGFDVLGSRHAPVLSMYTHIDRAAGAPAASTRGDAATRPAAEPGRRSPVVVAVALNGHTVSDGELVLREQGQYWLPVELLQGLSLTLQPDHQRVRYEGTDYAPVAQLGGVQTRLDPAVQQLELSASPSAFQGNEITAGSLADVDASPGEAALFLNYNTTLVSHDDEEQVNAALEVGVSKGEYVFLASGVGADLSGDDDWRRLQTSLVHDRPATRTRMVLGDATARPVDLSDPGNPYAFAGFQWSRNFDNDPRYVPYPLPTLYGEASGRSVVDLYVDQALRLRSEVDTGPFAIHTPPLADGSGDVEVVVRDASGRERVFAAPYQVSTRLLATDVVDFEWNAGLLRDEPGQGSDQYDTGFASGRYRRGLNDRLTGQVVAEATGDHVMLGGAGVVLVPGLGLASLTVAGSHADESAAAFGASIEHDARRWRASLSARHWQEDFAQLGREDGGRQLSSLYTAELGWSIGRRASLSLRYVDRERVNDAQAKLFSASYSQRLPGNLQLTVSASTGERSERQVADVGFESVEDTRVAVSLRKYLGRRQSIGVGYDYHEEKRASRSRESSGSVLNYRRNAAGPLGVGYGFAVEGGDRDRYSGAVDWNTRNGNLAARALRDDHGTTWFANLEGSLVAARGNVFLERPLRDGFAVVSTGDYADVNIYRNNQPVARTGADGVAVVPGLAPYLPNELQVRADELPLNARVDAGSQVAVPYFKGAAMVDFAIRREYGALLTLVDQAGVPLPVGTRVARAEGGESFPVARRGEVYVTDLSSNARYFATRPDGRRCAMVVSPPDDVDDNTIPRIGPVTCQESMHGTQ